MYDSLYMYYYNVHLFSLDFLSKLFIVKDKKHEDDNTKYGDGEDCCTLEAI
jgi:hypothetical protein